MKKFLRRLNTFAPYILNCVPEGHLDLARRWNARAFFSMPKITLDLLEKYLVGTTAPLFPFGGLAFQSPQINNQFFNYKPLQIRGLSRTAAHKVEVTA